MELTGQPVKNDTSESSRPAGLPKGTNNVSDSNVKLFSDVVGQKPATIEDFKEAVQDHARDILDNNSALIDELDSKYADTDSPAYDTLKMVIQKEQDLKKAEHEAYHDFIKKNLQYEASLGGAPFSNKDVVENPLKTSADEAQQRHENIQSAIKMLHSQYPELVALDTQKIDGDTSNEELYEEMSEGFDDIQEAIKECKEKIKDDIPLEALTNIVDEVRNDPKFAQIQDDISEWISDEKFKDNLIKFGTTTVAVAATLATLKFGGWGGAIIGGIGTGAGLAGSAYSFERSQDLYGVSKSQQIGDPLSETSFEEAKFDAVMAGIDLVLAGTDLFTAIKALKSLSVTDNMSMPKLNQEMHGKSVDGPSAGDDYAKEVLPGPNTTTKIKTRNDFNNPEEAYNYVRNLDGDIATIKKLDLKVSKTEVDMTKKNVREWFPEDEYPGIDYSIIDKKLDQYAGKAFDEKELKVAKEYLFDNPKFKPPENAADELNGMFYNNAESWMRLAEGKGNQADEILIKHEILETRIKYDLGLEEMGNKSGKKWYETHSDCHGLAEEIFNYSEAIKGIK